jgi:hypothetical protein
LVVARADLLPPDALELVLRPLEASGDATAAATALAPSVDAGGGDGNSAAGIADVAAGSRRCHILGREVRLPLALAVVLDYPLAWISGAETEGASTRLSAVDVTADNSLRAARVALRAALLPPTYKVLQRHGAVWVPFVDPAQRWAQAARAALDNRKRMHRSSDAAAAFAAALPTPTAFASTFAAKTPPPPPPPPPAVQAALAARFLGQAGAVSTVAQCLSARDDADFGVGGLDGSPTVVALLGPSGVGKTHLARQVASVLFAGQDPEVLEASGKLKRFAMNQYGSKEAVTNLLGADKGHVGQCEGAKKSTLCFVLIS